MCNSIHACTSNYYVLPVHPSHCGWQVPQGDVLELMSHDARHWISLDDTEEVTKAVVQAIHMVGVLHKKQSFSQGWQTVLA